MLMNESYRGRVEHVEDDAVVVVYEIDGSIVEQRYEKKQFIDGIMPNLGDWLEVTVTARKINSPWKVGLDGRARDMTEEELGAWRAELLALADEVESGRVESHRKPLDGPGEF